MLSRRSLPRQASARCMRTRVRTITACQGAVICPSGLINTTELAREFDERYYARELPISLSWVLPAAEIIA